MRVDEETLRFENTMREKSPRQILANVRRLYVKRRRIPNWALAMEVYGVGSTYGFWICQEHGIDPEAYRLDAFDGHDPSKPKQVGASS
jgi:hypothetical protein